MVKSICMYIAFTCTVFPCTQSESKQNPESKQSDESRQSAESRQSELQGNGVSPARADFSLTVLIRRTMCLVATAFRNLRTYMQ